MATAEPATRTCYRHPDRETGVSCSSCGRPICPDCMTPTPVGMRCPECAKQKTKVRTSRDIARGEGMVLTQVLIGLNVLAFVAQLGAGAGGLRGTNGTVYAEGVLFGPLVADGEIWRLVTGGFLHAGLLHIGLNMFLLYQLGQLLEPALGRARFGVLYAAGLLGGSLGVMLTAPDSPTLGASGAVFGLMGAAFIELRNRGYDPMRSGLGPLILINLVITFIIPGISIGGHVGGLVGGGLAAMLLGELDRRRAGETAAVVAGATLALAFGVAAFLAAGALAS